MREQKAIVASPNSFVPLERKQLEIVYIVLLSDAARSHPASSQQTPPQSQRSKQIHAQVVLKYKDITKAIGKSKLFLEARQRHDSQ